MNHANQEEERKRKHVVSNFHVPESELHARIFHLILSNIYSFDGKSWVLELVKKWLDLDLNFGSLRHCVTPGNSYVSETQCS